MALTRKERTLGCLWAMACGDALGVPSSFLTPEQIKSKYGWIDTFYPPEKGHIFHDGLLAGEYTDDTEQSMALMNAYIRDKKVVPISVVKEIIAWADRVKDKYASPLGPSTERALKNIAAGGDITVSGKWGNTNGSSMRIAPLGIIHGLRGSTLQELARDVALTDLATHNTRVCNAAATAIAWGVAQAMRGEENLDKIVDATIEAAAEGAKYGFSIPSPDIGMRIALACDIVRKAKDDQQALHDLAGRAEERLTFDVQRELAARSGVTHSLISLIEQNRSRVRLCMAAEARSSSSIRGRGGGGVGGLLGGLLVVAAVVWVVWVVMAWGPFEPRTWRASWLGEWRAGSGPPRPRP